MLAPHESSQAHREHIRTSGFLFTLSFWPCKESIGASSLSGASAVTIWPHHTHTAFKRFMLHAPDSSCRFSLHSPLKRYVWKRFLAGINEPLSQPKAFLKEMFTREWSLTSRVTEEYDSQSLLNPKMEIPVLLERQVVWQVYCDDVRAFNNSVCIFKYRKHFCFSWSLSLKLYFHFFTLVTNKN